MEEYCSFIENMLIESNNQKMQYDSFGCSAFVAQNENGDILFARNMDCEYAIPMLLHLNNEESIRSLSLVNMAVLDWDETTYDTLEDDPKLTLATAYSPYDGMNEFGFAVAILTDATAIYTNDSNKTTLFDMTLTRLLLDKAKTVDEAINYVREYNLFCDFAPLHYIVADSTGDAAVIEFVDGNMVITKKKERYLIVSNFTLYNNPSKEGFGKDRYDNYQNSLAKCNGIISEADALELLKSNVIPGDEQWSVVYNLTKRTLWVTFFGEYEQVYHFEREQA